MIRIFLLEKNVLNVDNNEDASLLLGRGAYELTENEIVSFGMKGYENFVSPSNTIVHENGRITFTPPSSISLKKAKGYKLQEINTACDGVLSQLTNTYPDQETATFYKQEQEARAYVADPTSPTPLLSALAQGRGIELDDLVQRVISKADAFAVASGSVIGQRQALEDQLDRCTTVDEVAAIVLKFVLPSQSEQEVA